MDWAEVNGVSLRYDVRGEGPSLVLIHEMGGTLESWDGVIDQLAAHFRVLRFDQRSAGWSEKVRTPFTLDDLATDLSELVTSLELLAPYHLVGAAAGAAVALAFHAMRSDDVASLAFLSPALEVDIPRAQSLVTRGMRAMTDGIRSVLPQSLERAWPAHLARTGTAYRDYRGRYLGNDPHGFALHNLALLDAPGADRVATVRVPTLLLAGAHDTVRPAAQVKELAATIPGAVYREVTAAHFMAVQAPTEVAAHLLAFHQKTAATAAASAEVT